MVKNNLLLRISQPWDGHYDTGTPTGPISIKLLQNVNLLKPGIWLEIGTISYCKGVNENLIKCTKYTDIVHNVCAMCNVSVNCTFIIGKCSQGKSTDLSVWIKLHNLKKNLIVDDLLLSHTWEFTRFLSAIKSSQSSRIGVLYFFLICSGFFRLRCVQILGKPEILHRTLGAVPYQKLLPISFEISQCEG